MVSEEIKNLIIKYFTQSANSDELDVLSNWVANEKNKSIFKNYIETHFAITLAMNEPDIKKIRERLQQEIRKEKKGIYNRRFIAIMKYASIAILFITVGFYLHHTFYENIEDQAIVPRKDAITLQLENGNIEIITEDGTSMIKDPAGKIVGVQRGKKLVYEDTDTKKKLVYNTLSVPNGQKFNIELSDGTIIHLNSGSSIKFPITFVKGKQRQVFLVGEAYFEVAHDRDHPFVVNAQNLDITVYGTKFNVSNYPEDTDMEIVLVDGSVSLIESNTAKTDNKEVFLKPGFMGVFNKVNNNISQEEVNTSIYTSWMNGNLVFRNIPFENIIQKLERHYNVVIINNNKRLAAETFNATIETKYETIEQVFNYFNKVHQIEYKIVENKIIIN